MPTNIKRAYKLQEFVAHSANVNCLKIGRKSSRVLLTGGEDHKVNLWAIGKPNSILSLSGHSSAVESINSDSSETLVAVGAASGTIKLWDLEEAKVVRTHTGHRSNCMTVDFHPFGEFFASGSLDTNLKIWDIRRKGCIHTYKGHTRGVNAIRFTPDGRWVVSGSEDNTVKLWDLTAGKLLHDFKCHEGPIQCIDFHPHEFLLATGSTDKTVKFWDLETFELIGSTGPEATSIRSMTFHPDGRTLLCGLHENLKVFSWEPIRCHDSVDVGWSKLSDLNIHEGKLLGCSFNQSCVGVWVVDLSCVDPYSSPSAAKLNGHSGKIASNYSVPNEKDSILKTTAGRSSQNSENNAKASVSRLSAPQTSDCTVKEAKAVTSAGISSASQSIGIASITKQSAAVSASNFSENTKRASLRSHSAAGPPTVNKVDAAPAIVPRASSKLDSDSRIKTADVSVVAAPRTSFRAEASSDNRKESVEAVPVVVPRTSSKTEALLDTKKDAAAGASTVAPVVVPRTNLRAEVASEGRKETAETGAFVALPRTRMEMTSDARRDSASGRTSPFSFQSRYRDVPKSSNAREEPAASNEGKNYFPTRNDIGRANSPRHDYPEDVRHIRTEKLGSDFPAESSPPHHNENYNARVRMPRACYVEISRGRTRSTFASMDSRDEAPVGEGPSTSSSISTAVRSSVYSSRGNVPPAEEMIPATDEDAVANLMEQHKQFLSSAQSRLSKLQIVHQIWRRNDVKGVIAATEQMADHAVSGDVVSILMEKSDVITLDLCAWLLPVLSSLLDSKTDRHVGISLDMLLKLVRVFGSVIYSTVSAGPSSVGVDIQAEQRLERCNLCFVELEKVKGRIPSLTRRRGSIAKSAQELNLALLEVP